MTKYILLILYMLFFIGCTTRESVMSNERTTSEEITDDDPYIFSILHGGLVNNEDIAMQLAQTYILNLRTKEFLTKQQPLIVEDRGASWRVKGSYNIEKRPDDDGPILIEISKEDGKIVGIKFPVIWGPIEEPTKTTD